MVKDQEESSNSFNVSELSDEQLNTRTCPLCNAPLMVRNTKNGHILGCTNYPVCSYIQNIKIFGVSILKILENSECPLCGDKLAIKKSKYGLFIGCCNYPDCKFIHSESEKSEVVCPKCEKGVLRQHSNKYGKVFYSCSNFKMCGYKVSYKPVNQSCPDCGYPILLIRVNKLRKFLQCPNQQCKKKMIYNQDV